jgi:hypothetical protein
MPSLFSKKKPSDGVIDVKASPITASAAPMPTYEGIVTELAPTFDRPDRSRRLQLPSNLKILPLALYIGAGVLLLWIGFNEVQTRRLAGATSAANATAAHYQRQAEALNKQIAEVQGKFSLASQYLTWHDYSTGIQPLLVAFADVFQERVLVSNLVLEQREHSKLKLSLTFQAVGDPQKFPELYNKLIEACAKNGWALDGDGHENGAQVNYVGTLSHNRQ